MGNALCFNECAVRKEELGNGGKPTETGHYVCIAAKPIFVEPVLDCF